MRAISAIRGRQDHALCAARAGLATPLMISHRPSGTPNASIGSHIITMIGHVTSESQRERRAAREQRLRHRLANESQRCAGGANRP